MSPNIVYAAQMGLPNGSSANGSSANGAGH
jgi:hypothetical protein